MAGPSSPLFPDASCNGSPSALAGSSCAFASSYDSDLLSSSCSLPPSSSSSQSLSFAGLPPSSPALASETISTHFPGCSGSCFAPSTSTGLLGTNIVSTTPFSFNVGGIIAIAASGVVVLIVGVVGIFFACSRYKRRRGIVGPVLIHTQSMRARGAAWRSPLQDETDSMDGDSDSADHSSTAGYGGASAEGNHLRSSSAHPGLGRAGASAAIAPSAWYSDGDVLARAPSSQGHSSYSTSHVHRSSSASSHAHFIQSPPSVTAYTTSSSATHPEPLLRSSIPTPPSSYSHGAPEETGVKDFFGHLRSGHTSSTHAPPTSQATFALGTPTHPTPRRIARPSSLLNPPVLLDPPVLPDSPVLPDLPIVSHGGEWGGWLQPSLMEDDAPRAREGLLRPGLPSQFPPSASTGTLGDHVDYSRPIGAGIRIRMESGNTMVSASSEGDTVIYR